MTGATATEAKLVCLLAPASKGTDPDETMHPALGGQEPEGVLPGDGEGGALYARLLALGVLDHLEPEAPPLGPALVHSHEHLGPVLRIHPARARVYGEYGVALIVLAGEEPGYLLLLEHPLDPPSSSLTSGSNSPSSSASSMSSPESERLAFSPSRSSTLPCTREKRADMALASSGSSQKPGRLMSSPSSSASVRNRFHVEERLQLGEASFQLGRLVFEICH